MSKLYNRGELLTTLKIMKLTHGLHSRFDWKKITDIPNLRRNFRFGYSNCCKIPTGKVIRSEAAGLDYSMQFFGAITTCNQRNPAVLGWNLLRDTAGAAVQKEIPKEESSNNDHQWDAERIFGRRNYYFDGEKRIFGSMCNEILAKTNSPLFVLMRLTFGH